MTLRMAVGLFCYGLILLFGVGITTAFVCGREQTGRQKMTLLAFSICCIAVQIVSWRTVGLERTKQLYPLIVHLPLSVFVTVAFQKQWLQAAVGVCSAYLCLQIPRWMALLVHALFREQVFYFAAYIPSILLSYSVLRRYVSGPVQQLTEQSRRSCMLLGAVPCLYYIFDYATTVYTGWLYTGAQLAVQFIPSVVAVFYFVFVVIYYAETQKQAAARREREQLEVQFRQARTELSAIRLTQEQTRQYRHDMRHHFTLLQALAAEGDLDRITEYLHTARSDLDAFTPTRYCENETANLLLSSFESRARQNGVRLTVDARLPEELPLSDTELCSLLSNGLENAIAAAAALPEGAEKTVALRAAVFQKKLLLSVDNPYAGEVEIRDGLPWTGREGHGYGTRNVSVIAEQHGGQALFTARDGLFSLKIMLPMRPADTYKNTP